VPKDLSQRYLSTAETAAALGVTPRALRLYEARGLVRPLRTDAGWRAYGPEQVARLHQILALKRLGLPLRAIGELLAGRFKALDDRTGRVVWETNLGSPVSGYPITFAIDGKQYVAVATGPSGVATATLRLTPELKPSNAGQVYVFALP